MSEEIFQKQTQDYHSRGPVIVLGSGASAAHGMPGMGELAQHLLRSIDLSGLPQPTIDRWEEFRDALSAGQDLESALHRVQVPDELTGRIIRATWSLIHDGDARVFGDSLQNVAMFPLSRLLRHIFGSSLSKIEIITTNYDRLAEYACDQEALHHYTGFTHGFIRQLAPLDAVTAKRQVNIWKVHGSLDWFTSPLRETVAIANVREIPQHYEPQIVTPGTQKYQKTHLEPFRSIINNADRAIEAADSYLCIGYGFNDEHIQPKLMARCIRHNKPLTIITHTLSDAAKRLVLEGGAPSFVAIERGNRDDESIVHSSLSKTPLKVERNIWALHGYLSLIM